MVGEAIKKDGTRGCAAAGQLHRQHDDEERAGGYQHPRRLGQDAHIGGFLQHGAPTGCGFRKAESEKRNRRFRRQQRGHEEHELGAEKAVSVASTLLFLYCIGAIVGLALFFGDGMLTPAITVLSAVEGLSVP